MEIKLKRKRKIKGNKVKYLFLPIIHRNILYWLQTVKIEKNFNGVKLVTTNIEKID